MKCTFHQSPKSNGFDQTKVKSTMTKAQTERVKHKQVITIGQQIYLAFIQIKNDKIVYLN